MKEKNNTSSVIPRMRCHTLFFNLILLNCNQKELCRNRALLSLFSFKFIPVFGKQFVIGAHIGKLVPRLRDNGMGIKIVNLRAAHRKQKGRMGGNHQLTAVKTHRILQKPSKLCL